jgi:hypothetical protein
MNPNAMFAALEDCRTSLQQISPHIEPENRQRLVTDIIGELVYIQRRKEAFFEAVDHSNISEMYEEIDTAKRNIIGNLVDVSKLANVAYVLPRDLTQSGAFFAVEEANQPLCAPLDRS